MADVQVTVTDNGPYKVTGTIDLFDADGNQVETKSSTVFLCRCGGSTNKPFCDGTHATIDFDGTPTN